MPEEVKMYYVEDDHEATIVIDTCIWKCVQLEFEWRGTYFYFRIPETNSFASRIVCRTCNKVFSRKGWRSSAVKGTGCKVFRDTIPPCGGRNAIKVYFMAWNAQVGNCESFLKQ